MKTFLAILLTIFALSSASELPENLIPCRRSAPNYNECLTKSIPIFTISIGAGSKSLKIRPIEPLLINKIKIGENNGPVALKQEYENAHLHGLTKGLILSDANMDFDKLIFRLESYNPQIYFTADYVLDGHFLVVPVRGRGRSNITMINLRTTNTIYCEKFEKDGETYLRAKEYKIKLIPEKVIMHYDNLFDGDKTLGAPVNALLEESSDMIFKELRGPYEEIFGAVFKGITNDVLTKYPMNQLFLE